MGKKRYPLGVLLAGNAGPHGGASKYTTNGSLFRSLFMCRRKLILRLTNVDHSPQYNIVSCSVIRLWRRGGCTRYNSYYVNAYFFRHCCCTSWYFRSYCYHTQLHVLWNSGLEHQVIRCAWLLVQDESVPLRNMVSNYSNKKDEISISK